MVFTANAFAADKTSDYEQDKIVITYDEAVQKAIDNTTSIAAIDEAVDLMEKNKEALFTSLEGYFPYVSSDVTVDSSIGSLLSSIGTIDSSTKSYRYQKQMLEETAELMVKNYFNTIVTSENALELTKESLQLKQEEYSQLVMKHNLGMLSDNELETAKNEITKMMSNVTTAELAIDSVYESLASTIGLSKYADFEIDYELEYEPFTCLLYTSIVNKHDTVINNHTNKHYKAHKCNRCNRFACYEKTKYSACYSKRYGKHNKERMNK